ncbi:MAG: hypothetical protein AAFX93_15675 [Verrucomicrobiota bacterium]
MILTAKLDHDAFNELIKAGTAEATMKAVIENTKPEAVYFHCVDGLRTMTLIVDLQEAAQIPTICEPFFIKFGADVDFQPCAVPADFEKCDWNAITSQWG